MSFVQQAVLAKKAALADAVSEPMARLGERCIEAWPDAEALDRILQEAIGTIPHCHLLYAWDINGIEISSMVQATGVDRSWRGRDLSQRPYLKNHLPFKGVMLSSVYMSEYVPKQCITALQAVSKDNNLLGFIAADFALADLIQDEHLTPPEMHWKQFRGDPAVRGTVFMQERTPSLLDQHIDEVLDLIHRLMSHHGIFHSKIHFSSGRCSLWLFDDPYNYRLLGIDEIINPDICLAYPVRPYPAKAKVTPEQIRRVLDEFKALRFADETIYLRSSSINLMNGLVGLTFSCDGSHYLRVEEFLARDFSFWMGALHVPMEAPVPEPSPMT